MLQPYGMDKCPWQYRKINGRWYRRPANTNSGWAALRIDSMNEWTWS